MGVELAVADGAYPCICAVYRCSDCGGTVTKHGREAASPPPGWRVEKGEDERALCPRCAS
jgi:DNA-directed RNA polymerase subunit RPC12/RpoP